jgi:hypothetical protein
MGASIRLLPSYGSHSASLRPQDQVHGLVHFFTPGSSQHSCCDRLVKRTAVELAEVMARPADPQSVIDAIKERRSESAHASGKADGPEAC